MYACEHIQFTKHLFLQMVLYWLASLLYSLLVDVFPSVVILGGLWPRTQHLSRKQKGKERYSASYHSSSHIIHVSYYITSYCIVSYHITSSYYITSFRIVSYKQNQPYSYTYVVVYHIMLFQVFISVSLV